MRMGCRTVWRGGATLVLLGFATVAGAQRPAETSARMLPVVEIERICQDIREWFRARDAQYNRWAQTGGLAGLRAYAESAFVADSGLVLREGSGRVVYSVADFLGPLKPSDVTADGSYRATDEGTDVALISSTRALYLRRELELDSAYYARGQVRPHGGILAGNLVRTPRGWRIREQVLVGFDLDTLDQLSRAPRWRCR